MIGNQNIINIDLPVSKSVLNRLLIISTICRDKVYFDEYSNCKDIRTLTDNLQILGWQVIRENDAFCLQQQTEVRSAGLKIIDSATALRFLVARLCVWDGISSELDASEQLAARPISSFLHLLRRMGAQITGENYPYQIYGKKLEGGSFSISADVSSQFISAILLVAPLFKKGLHLKLTGNIVSKGYIELTKKMMEKFGVKVNSGKDFFEVEKNSEYRWQGVYHIEPDFSSACYFWALGALSGQWIATKTETEGTLQPDFQFTRILSEMGAEVEINQREVRVRVGQLRGIEVDMSQMPDQVPTLAALAVFALTPTKIENIAHLKYKESDRINSVCQELSKLGVKIRRTENSITIFPSQNLNSQICFFSHHDHRIAMSLAIIKMKIPTIRILGSEAVEKSFPSFWTQFDRLKRKS
jgi:3-phosphoshikimate 1-carboxyvinyltransferase